MLEMIVFMKKIKDPFSGFSHLFGAVLSVAGLVILIVMAAFYSNEKACYILLVLYIIC